MLFKYKRIMSAIFFVASVTNFYLFSAKVYLIQYEQIGFLKRVIWVSCFCLILYNMLYCFQSSDHWFTRLLDSFVNSLMMALVLFLNLLLIDAQTLKIYSSVSQSGRLQGPEEKIKSFYLPKLGVCVAIFVLLYFFMYTHSFRLVKYITQMYKQKDSIDTGSIVGSFDFTDLLCLCLFSVYTVMAFRWMHEAYNLANAQYQKNRTKRNYNLHNLLFMDSDSEIKTDLTVTRFATVLPFFVSILLLSLIFAPAQDEMLQFVDESGLINVYLIILSFLFSPIEAEDLIRIEGQIEAMNLQSQLYTK